MNLPRKIFGEEFVRWGQFNPKFWKSEQPGEDKSGRERLEKF